MFENGCMSANEAKRLDHPTTATTAQKRRVTVNKIAKQLNISIRTAYFVMPGNLQLNKVCAR
jgi:hypothetical protein